MNTNWIKKWHPVIITFLIGLALGAVFNQWASRECFAPRWEKRAFHHREKGDMKDRMLKHMSRELHLSAEQEQQVSAIFEAKQPEMAALHSEMRSKFEALRNAARAEIRKVLTPEQQKKADQMEAEMEKHHPDGPMGRPHHGGPGEPGEPFRP